MFQRLSTRFYLCAPGGRRGQKAGLTLPRQEIRHRKTTWQAGSQFQTIRTFHSAIYLTEYSALKGQVRELVFGDYVLDLKILARQGVFNSLDFDVSTLEQLTLNAYTALDKHVHRKVREYLLALLNRDTQHGQVLRDNEARRNECIVPQSKATTHLPTVIGDYTDFFVGLQHAESVRCV